METLIVVGADELVLMGRYIHFFIYHFFMLIVFHYGLARCVRNILKGAAISFVMSVHLSTWNYSANTGWIFVKFDI
jgi:hypothetical protein